MAAPFVCSDCGYDGTRCDCHKERLPTIRGKTIEERIEENAEEIAANVERLRRALEGSL